jgi:glycosyltransferase involved in cell wall biosynthesis
MNHVHSAVETAWQPPRVAYDARLALGHYRGMGRYLRQLIAGREQDLLGFCATGERDPSLNLVASGHRAYPLWEQLSIPRLVRNYSIQTFLAPFNTAPLRLPRSVKLAVVVYDLIFMDGLPLSLSLYQNAGRLYRRLVVPRAIQRAAVVVTCSEYTAAQLTSRFRLDASRIRVIPVGLGEEWFSARSVPRGDGNRPYLFAVAGEAPSKNLGRAIAAFAQFRRFSGSNVRMKVAGVKPKYHSRFQREARRLGVADGVDFLCYIPESEMRGLYQNAELFIMPSVAEGFGIPVLEAMAAGVPVAVSSASSLPEVAGDAARYFDPLSVDDMASAIGDVVCNPELKQEMATRSVLQARKFNQDVINRKIAEFWSELSGGEWHGSSQTRKESSSA